MELMFKLGRSSKQTLSPSNYMYVRGGKVLEEMEKRGQENDKESGEYSDALLQGSQERPVQKDDV